MSPMSHIQVYSDIAYANTNMFTGNRDENWQIVSSFSTLTIIYMVRITRVRIFITRKSSLWNGSGINITQILNLKEKLNLHSFFFHNTWNVCSKDLMSHLLKQPNYFFSFGFSFYFCFVLLMGVIQCTLYSSFARFKSKFFSITQFNNLINSTLRMLKFVKKKKHGLVPFYIWISPFSSFGKMKMLM